MIKNLTIKSFHDGLIKREFSAREVVAEIFSRIKAEDKEIGAYLSLAEDEALKQAEAVDNELAVKGDVGILAGVPLAIKDNILIQGMPATAASKILENYTAPCDATVIKKLKEAGAIFLGKTNMDEFAMGSSTENSAFKQTKNPHDLTRVPGGSSGGSAAAVAANMAVAALGSDTGGSIREPASFCGTVGFKPTYGAVSRFGLIAMASSLDQIGPITKTVEDAAILFSAINGKDALDSTSADFKFNFEGLDEIEGFKELTIGLPEEYFIDGIDEATKTAIEEAISRFKSLGFKFKKISLPHTKYALSCYYIIMPAEVSANLARFDGIRYTRINTDNTRIDTDNPRASEYHPRKSALEDIYFKTRGHGFGEEVKRRAMLGTFVLSAGYYDAYYDKAQKVRQLIKKDFDEAFKEVDIILTPVAPTPAFKIGEKTDDPLKMYLSDIFTIPANLAGLPAISIPTTRINTDNTRINTDNISVNPRNNPRESASMPVGFQLIGRHFREADILAAGMLYEKEI